MEDCWQTKFLNSLNRKTEIKQSKSKHTPTYLHEHKVRAGKIFSNISKELLYLYSVRIPLYCLVF